MRQKQEKKGKGKGEGWNDGEQTVRRNEEIQDREDVCKEGRTENGKVSKKKSRKGDREDDEERNRRKKRSRE